MVKLGREVPVASMDNSGKIIWAKHNEIQTVNIKSIGADAEVWAPLYPLPCNMWSKKCKVIFLVTHTSTMLLRLLMEKGYLWLLRSWALVIFTHKWVNTLFLNICCILLHGFSIFNISAPIKQPLTDFRKVAYVHYLANRTFWYIHLDFIMQYCSHFSWILDRVPI